MAISLNHIIRNAGITKPNADTAAPKDRTAQMEAHNLRLSQLGDQLANLEVGHAEIKNLGMKIDGDAGLKHLTGAIGKQLGDSREALDSLKSGMESLRSGSGMVSSAGNTSDYLSDGGLEQQVDDVNKMLDTVHENMQKRTDEYDRGQHYQSNEIPPKAQLTKSEYLAKTPEDKAKYSPPTNDPSARQVLLGLVSDISLCASVNTVMNSLYSNYNSMIKESARG